jgi:hypothetical protein
LLAAINNPKAKADKPLLEEAYKQYELWTNKVSPGCIPNNSNSLIKIFFVNKIPPDFYYAEFV